MSGDFNQNSIKMAIFRLLGKTEGGRKEETKFDFITKLFAVDIITNPFPQSWNNLGYVISVHHKTEIFALPWIQYSSKTHKNLDGHRNFERFLTLAECDGGGVRSYLPNKKF